MAPEVLHRVYAVVPRDSQLRTWIIDRVQEDPAGAVDALRHTADDMAWMLETLRLILLRFDRWERARADAILAQVAGVEAVWAREPDRVGDLRAMAPRVRESMATGDAEPLIRAALAPAAEAVKPAVHWWDTPRPDPSREEADLDVPLGRPLEALICSWLDGHVATDGSAWPSCCTRGRTPPTKS